MYDKQFLLEQAKKFRKNYTCNLDNETKKLIGNSNLCLAMAYNSFINHHKCNSDINELFSIANVIFPEIVDKSQKKLQKIEIST